MTDASIGQPVASAQITVVGTSVGALTNNNGELSIRRIPAGPAVVRALRLGYASRIPARRASRVDPNVALRSD